MEEINKFINFLFRNIKDDRISLHKEMVRGHRYYHLMIVLEKEETDLSSNSTYNIYNELTITIDNENNCINMINSYYENKYTTIESKDLVKSWSDKFEKYLSENVEQDIKTVIHNTMSDVKDKDLYRDYKMEKIFKEDESL